MDRKETTQFLSDLLVRTRLSAPSTYWASEVWLNYGNSKENRRVDFMEFKPAGVTYESDIEKGIFTCYEVKSCMADLLSGHGTNFVGEKNYFCMPMLLWKQIAEQIQKSLRENTPPPAYWNYPKAGIMVPIPSNRPPYEARDRALQEFRDPTPLDSEEVEWQYYVIQPCHQTHRKYSMTALLFWMLRAGH